MNKKIGLSILGFIFLCFAIPIIFTGKFIETSYLLVRPNEVVEEDSNPFNYGEVNDIKLLITSTR